MLSSGAKKHDLLNRSLLFPFSLVVGGTAQVGKGIGKGIRTGDGTAIVEGFKKGTSSLGSGIAGGAGTAVTGAAGGIFSVGKGLVSGVKNVGKGVGGAITNNKKDGNKSKK